MYDLKIINGQVYDGNGGEVKLTNIAVTNGVIVEVGECSGDAKRVVDASGAIVTPGFVDVHTHYDGQISWD